jgi:hypothetical protein
MDAILETHRATLFTALFSGDPPSLVLPTESAQVGARAGSPRPARSGTLSPGEVRKAVAETARNLPAKPARDRLRVLEGLALLWHDHWDAAHEIAQSKEGEPDHDLLHAILHRREGDFANAGYWFGGSGKHPCYQTLPLRIAALSIEGMKATGLLEERWSARVFLAAVRADAELASRDRVGTSRTFPTSPSSPSSAVKDTLVRVQAEEFRVFAAYLAGI